jgi:hypothetical protein
VSGYKVTAGKATVRVKTFQEVGPVIMEAVTNLLALDPEGAADDAMTAKRAWSAGEVRHAVDTHGSWRTRVTVRGEPIQIVVVREDP